jgi:protease I
MTMAHDVQKKSVAFLVATAGVEQVELTHPWTAVEEAGANAVLVAPEAGSIQAFNHLDKGESYPVDVTLDLAAVEQFDVLVLPGGVANPDQLRTIPAAVDFVRAFVESGKPVAAICHAPWILAEADVLRGRTLTSWPSLHTDLRNAGAVWVDKELVVDNDGPGPLVTSRKPNDLPAFSAKVVELLGV